MKQSFFTFFRFDIFVFDSFFQRTYLYPASADDNHNPSFQNDCSKGRKEKYEEIFFWRESFLEDDLLAFYFFRLPTFSEEVSFLCVTVKSSYLRFSLCDFGVVLLRL
jgi:hypothetical protein